MKVLGIVVLYYPDKFINKNIASYINGIDKLIIWQNTPNNPDIEFAKEFRSDKIVYAGVGENVGIGKALNYAIDYGIKHGYTHLMTMDQDSCFANDQFDQYIKLVMANTDKAVVSFSSNTNLCDKSVETFSYIDIAITSGTIYKTAIFSKIGKFREDLFIDGIDTEFCFRIKDNGYKMVRHNHTYMDHKLGNVTSHPFLWGKLLSPNYSAQRTYYLTRNSLLIKRMYPKHHLSEGHFKTILFWRPLCIAFVEKDKLKKTKAFIIGLFHALINKKGIYLIG